MSYMDTYKSRLLSYGNNSTDTQLNASKNVIEKSFVSNPSFKLVKINNAEVGVIVENGKNSTLKNVLFKPDTVYDSGIIVEIDSLKYLIIDFQNHLLYPTANMQLCNNTLTITTESTKTIVGHDSLNRPIYDVIPGATLQYPCIVQSLTNYYSGTSQAINVPEGRILISISNTTNTNIAVGKKFTIFNTDYRINALDRSKTLNDKGILDIIADKITD